MTKFYILLILGIVTLCFSFADFQDSISPNDAKWQNNFYYDYFQVPVKSGMINLQISSSEIDLCFFEIQESGNIVKECVDPGYGPLQITRTIQSEGLFQFGIAQMFANEYGAYSINASGAVTGPLVAAHPFEQPEDPAEPDFTFQGKLDDKSKSFNFVRDVCPGYCFIIDVVSPECHPSLTCQTPDGRTINSIDVQDGHTQAILKINKIGKLNLQITSKSEQIGQFFVQALSPINYNQPPSEWLPAKP